MNAYVLLVALVLIAALIMHGTQEGNKKYVIFACILLFVIYGLRDTFVIGNDSSTSYLVSFRRMRNYSFSEVLLRGDTFNQGYWVLNKIFYDVTGGDYQFFITSVSIFVTICFGRMIYQYSPNPLASILLHFGLLFFTFHFSALKQSIAMAFLMLAFEYIVKGKPVRFVVTALVASWFHFPSIVFLPAYWIAKLKIGRSYLLFLAGLLSIVYIFRNDIINFMFDMYRGEDSNVDLSNVQFFRTKAIIMALIVIVAVLLRKPQRDDHVYSILLGYMGLAIVFQTFCGYNNIFERLADYYFQFSVIFIPMIFDKSANRHPLLNWRFVEIIDTFALPVFCCYGIYRFLSVTLNDAMLSPYKFFFQS